MIIQGTAITGTTVSSSAATVAADSYFNLVSLLLPGNGTNGAQNNTFVDASTNNFTITRNGNTTQGTFSPFSQTGWSNYFDGSGDSITAPDNVALEFGSGDFTIEAWIYLTAYSASYSGNFAANIVARDAVGARSYIFSVSGTASSFTSLNFINFNSSGDANLIFSASATVNLNTWYHVAVSRSSTTFRLFLDGTLIGTTTSAVSVLDTATHTRIGSGAYSSFEYYTTGYISNVRIVKGTAVYTATFTPSTTPLTAISGTSLLTCQSNRFIDNSSNAFAITVNGNTAVQAFAPFDPTTAYSAATVGGSAYFDGTGDYLTAPYNSAWDFGTGDFTIESWLYRTALGIGVIAASFTSSGNDGWSFEINSSNQITFYAEGAFLATSSATIPANTWTHVAASRSGTTLRLFIDGALATTVTNSTSIAGFSGLLAISATATGVAPFVGYQSNFRVVKGTAVYTSGFVPPTAPLTNITNTGFLLSCTNGGITDATAKNVLETVGSAQISTAQSKWGGSSMLFDGTGDYLTFPSSPNFALGSTDFTVEYWINTAASADDGILQISTTPGGFATSYTNGLMMAVVSGVLYYALGGSAVNTSTTINNGNWRHIAMSRSGSSLKIFVDGTQVSSATNSNSVTGTYLVVGGYYSTSFTLNGYINDLRITRGLARYTANFTPPTAAFPTQ